MSEIQTRAGFLATMWQHMKISVAPTVLADFVLDPIVCGWMVTGGWCDPFPFANCYIILDWVCRNSRGIIFTSWLAYSFVKTVKLVRL